MLVRRSAQAKILALTLLLLALLSGDPAQSWGWRLAALLLALAWWDSDAGLVNTARFIWRLRWLLLAIALLHLWLTPGPPLALLSWSLPISFNGVIHGLAQAARLLTFAIAAWVFARVTPMASLMAAVGRWLPTWAPPSLQRALAIAAHALTVLGQMRLHAARYRQGVRLHAGAAPRGAMARMGQWTRFFDAMITRVLWQARQQEWALRARGFDALPLDLESVPPWRVADWALLAAPLLALLLTRAGV
ncbi:CbiQ family ECF transporter T component [Magnetofaba australis]|uniref:Cobalt transport protein n=1 Tax=Magnetofaba australis IT-1 TaxID=1434232 RepID=A0A1Y2K889_9PROT|nr:CbiQ family ECF transporter T component [Magnetofaba australis]OSM05005.1 hypothetical protein MAIT1_03133 [Magnetofaba australis IT-1]